MSTENDEKPTIIYSAYFEVPSSLNEFDYVEKQEGPIYQCCGPFMELDYDESIRQSKLLYQKMYPEDEFLPKAPEPEEIIIGDEDLDNANLNLGVLTDLVNDITDNESKDQEQELQQTNEDEKS